MLVRVTTPSGNDGFFKFVPPTGTFEIRGEAATFHALDRHGRGPSINAKLAGVCQAEVTFSSEETLISFSDYAVRAGARMTTRHQPQDYHAALAEWERGRGTAL